LRGSIRTRYKGSWNIILDMGYRADPETGKPKRIQKWYTIRGTKRDAEKKLAELLHAANRNELVEPTKMTLGTWLETWLETAIKPPNKRYLTYRSYTCIIHHHLVPALGTIRLQALQPTDLKHYYTSKSPSLATSSLSQHHAILSAALKAAQMQGLVSRNVATLVVGKPRPKAPHDGARQACWSAEEARSFLAVAQAAEDPQIAAFYALALDSGARKGELCGLRWVDVDLKRGQITIVQQLLRDSVPPLFGPTKRSTPRVIPLGPKTLELLRRHKAVQAQAKLANRPQYRSMAWCLHAPGPLAAQRRTWDALWGSNISGIRGFAASLPRLACGPSPFTVSGIRAPPSSCKRVSRSTSSKSAWATHGSK